MTDMAQDKATLRKFLRDKLNAMSDEDRALQSDRIFQRARSLALPDGGICVYNSLPSEVSTKRIIEYFVGKRDVYIPVVDRDELLLVKVGKDSEYRPNVWGILEPTGERLSPSEVAPTVTFTPLLGVDRSLNRLGKGKGFYDRYFAKTDTLRIGLAFEEQIVESAPSDRFDKPLDVLVTARGVIIRAGSKYESY